VKCFRRRVDLMLVAAAVACVRVSPLADNNVAHNRASGAPTVRHQLCRAPVPLPRSGAQGVTRLGLHRVEDFAIQIAVERMQCGSLRIRSRNCRNSSRQSPMQAMLPVALRAFARPRAAVFGFLILDGPSWTTLPRGVHRKSWNGFQPSPDSTR
jgi:hypothetical protein